MEFNDVDLSAIKRRFQIIHMTDPLGVLWVKILRLYNLKNEKNIQVLWEKKDLPQEEKDNRTVVQICSSLAESRFNLDQEEVHQNVRRWSFQW